MGGAESFLQAITAMQQIKEARRRRQAAEEEARLRAEELAYERQDRERKRAEEMSYERPGGPGASPARTEAERQSLVPEAREAYAAGRPQMMQVVAPDEAQALGANKAKVDQEKAQRAANVQRIVAQGLKEGRIRPEQARQILQQTGVMPTELGPLGNPQHPSQTVNPALLEAQAGGVLGVQPDETKPDTLGISVTNETSLRRDTPEYRAEYARRRKEAEDREAAENARERASRASGRPENAAAKLRQEFTRLPAVKAMDTVAASYNTVLNTAPTAAGDASLLYAVIKMYDPNTGVREHEYATIQNAASVPDRIRNAYNKAKDGQFLTPEQRESWRREAGQLFSSRQQVYKKAADYFTSLAQRQGVDPQDVIIDYGYNEQKVRTRDDSGSTSKDEKKPSTRPRKTLKGETREWDGTKWVPITEP